MKNLKLACQVKGYTAFNYLKQEGIWKHYEKRKEAFKIFSHFYIMVTSIFSIFQQY